MDKKVVRSYSPLVAQDAVALLGKKGLAPEIVGFPTGLARHVARSTMKLKLAVPQEQAEEADRILTEWEAGQVREVAELSGTVWRHMVLAVAPAGLFAAAVWLTEGEFPAWAINTTIVLLLGMVIVLGIVQRVRLSERAVERWDDD
jgi:hypothetical protein